MKRKGWLEEYEAKKILISRFGNLGVIKVAIAQFGADFICLQNGRAVLAVEVKATHKPKFYPNKREKEQFKRIKEFCEYNNCKGELWIKYPYKAFEVKDL